jgi:hypothetical protein
MGLTEADAKGRTTKLEVIRSNGEWQIRSTDAAGRTLNKTWEEIIGSNYTDVVSNPAVDEVQIWEITNKSGGWFHPVHIHLVDFKMLTRNGKPVFNYEQGPKDVMYVGENETIRAVMRFGERFAKPGGGYYSWADAGLTGTIDPEITGADYRASGRYMIHCHNLPHEDHDMMTQFQVGKNTEKNDPCPVNPADPQGGSNPARKGDGDVTKYKLHIPTLPGPRIDDADPV